jgi:hypothetical protein
MAVTWDYLTDQRREARRIDGFARHYTAAGTRHSTLVPEAASIGVFQGKKLYIQDENIWKYEKEG